MTEPVDETPILVDFEDEYGFVETALAPSDLARKSAEALDRAMGTIQAMARRVSALRASLPDEFTQVELEFGVKLDAEAGALLSKVGGEASINVTLTWERRDRKAEVAELLEALERAARTK